MANAKLISMFTELQRQGEKRMQADVERAVAVVDDAIEELWEAIRALERRLDGDEGAAERRYRGQANDQGTAEQTLQGTAQAVAGGVENEAGGEVQVDAEEPADEGH
jgi:hypothetical protein